MQEKRKRPQKTGVNTETHGNVVFIHANTPRPPEFVARIQNASRRYYLTLSALLILCILIYRAVVVTGSDLSFYPSTCFGSWQHSDLAQDKPDLSENAALPEFTDTNSAMLAGGSGQIICGAFVGDGTLPDTQFKKAEIRFSLAFAAHLPLVPQSGAILDETTSSDASITAPFSASSDLELILNPSSSTSSATTTLENLPPAPSSDLTAPAEPTSSSSTEPSAAPSSTEQTPSAFQLPFIHTAHAQTAENPVPVVGSALGTIEYSFDSSHWVTLGAITSENWNQLRFEIPVSLAPTDQTAEGTSTPAHSAAIERWDDVSLIQFRVTGNVFSLENESALYLDGMMLVLTAEDAPVQQETPSDSVFSAIKKTYTLLGKAIPTKLSLDWQSQEVQSELDKKPNVSDSVTTYDSERKTIIASGSCHSDYYVVLVYRGSTDYDLAPSSAVYNSASKCNGSYSLDVDSLNLPVGTYYLLIADEPAHGPWVPISALTPFEVQ